MKLRAIKHTTGFIKISDPVIISLFINSMLLPFFSRRKPRKCTCGVDHDSVCNDGKTTTASKVVSERSAPIVISPPHSPQPDDKHGKEEKKVYTCSLVLMFTGSVKFFLFCSLNLI